MSSAASLGMSWSFCEDVDQVSISFAGLDRQNRLRSSITLFNGVPGLQIVPILRAYLEKTEHQRCESSKLFVGLNRPHSNLKSVTIRNEFISAMEKANIDTSKFGPHSARASVSSAPGITLKEILSLGCWRNASTYRRFYSAEITE